MPVCAALFLTVFVLVRCMLGILLLLDYAKLIRFVFVSTSGLWCIYNFINEYKDNLAHLSSTLYVQFFIPFFLSFFVRSDDVCQLSESGFLSLGLKYENGMLAVTQLCYHSEFCSRNELIIETIQSRVFKRERFKLTVQSCNSVQYIVYGTKLCSMYMTVLLR